MSEVEALFDRCVVRNDYKDGSLEIKCCLGLWQVSGRDKQFVESESRRYWIQYFYDGEYEKLLSTP